MVPSNIFGEIPIRAWEWGALFVYLVIIFLISSIIHRRNIDLFPEYKYFNLGLMAKVGGGLGFALIYIFYYGNGDTFSYYETSLALSNMLTQEPGTFWEVYFGGATPEMKSKFTPDMGIPYGYIYFNNKNLLISKLLLPFLLMGFKSYLLSTVIVSVFTYSGLWQLFKVFNRYFPHLKFRLAIAILFMPSVVFWGSGILKDSFALAATCFFISSTDALINRRTNQLINWIGVLLSGLLILSIKPYIIIILIPGTLVWYFYKKISSIKNKLLRYLVIPFIYIGIFLGSYGLLTSLGGQLGKFSLDKAFKMAKVIQSDLKQEYYEGHTFDIGEFSPTPKGVLSKFPIATVSGLYRPFIWESKNAVMFISSIETTFLLLLTIIMLLKNRWLVLFKFFTQHPILIYSIMFSILFAFMVGVTTPNFGALVRFRIPFLPLFTASLLILNHSSTLEYWYENRKKELND